MLRDLPENKIPIFEREGWLCQPSLPKIGILLIRRSLRIADEMKPEMFDEKRGVAALLIKHKEISEKEYPSV